ncbi:MAG: NAAT family transporter [Phycisphaeraceae bacterium]|nr:NAAT family transporter [Phycisphaeraceae bacterium]
MDWSFALTAFLSLLAILNPLGALPIYLAVAPEGSPKIVRETSLAVLVALLVFALLGHGILLFFGITLPAFRVAGGILLLLMGITMLHGDISRVKHTPEEARELPDRASTSIVPLAIPILVGPGSITTVILLAQDATTWFRRISVLAAILLSTSLIYALLRGANRLHKLLGRTGINIFSRVMGLILASVAVQFMADGVLELLPGLRG